MSSRAFCHRERAPFLGFNFVFAFFFALGSLTVVFALTDRFRICGWANESHAPCILRMYVTPLTRAWQAQTDTDRHRQAQTDTDSDRQTHTQTQRGTDRHRQTQKDADRHRLRQTDRQTQTGTASCAFAAGSRHQAQPCLVLPPPAAARHSLVCFCRPQPA